MNAKSRIKIGQLLEKLEEIKGEVEELQSDEDQKYGNLPDALQQGQMGEAMEMAASTLADAGESLDAAISSLYEIQ